MKLQFDEIKKSDIFLTRFDLANKSLELLLLFSTDNSN